MGTFHRRLEMSRPISVLVHFAVSERLVVQLRFLLDRYFVVFESRYFGLSHYRV